jgi:type 1 glutamine amidotransferase
MNLRTLASTALTLAVLAAGLAVVPANAGPKPPHFLLFTGTYGFRHDGIQEEAAELQRQAAETGRFTLEVSGDLSALTQETYRRVDGVILLQTTGLSTVPEGTEDDQLDRESFVDFFECGAGLVGIHAAADSGDGWPEYDALLGSGGFDSHPHFSFESRENPAGRQAFNPAVVSDVTIQVEDKVHPTTRPWHGFESFRITDELYRYDTDPRDSENLSVLLSLDEESHYWRSELGAGPSAGGLAPSVENPVPNPVNALPPTQMPDNNPIAWVRTQEKGRIFYTNLGHNMATWERSDFRAHVLAGIEWVAGQRPERSCLSERWG